MKRLSSRLRGPRLLQRQRGEESEIDRAVGGRTRIERVDDVVGLAEPERQPDHELPADIADDVLGDRIGIGENLSASDRRLEWQRPESGARFQL